jgi:hypothetical protein
MEKEYLGDGLYARSDGYGVWITSEDGISVLNQVYFEPSVYASFKKYWEDLYGEKNQESTEELATSDGS